MAGISSRAANVLENRYKANGGTEYSSKEFTDGTGLDWYDTDFRRYNAQIGRFTGLDALSAFAPDQSPYSFVQNNPISFIDPQGLDTVRVNGEGSHKIKVRQGDVLAWTIGETTSYYTYDPNNENAVSGFVGGGIDGGDLPEVTVRAKAKPKEDAGGSNLKDQITWGIDAGFSITESSRATFRLTNGSAKGNAFSPKWYSPSPATGRGWGGGSRAGIKTFKVSSVAKVGSWGLFGVGVAMDGIGVYKYYKAPNTNQNAFIQSVHPAKAGLNTGMGIYSLYVNPIAGALYFGVDAFYPGGWQSYGSDYDRIQKANAAIVPGFITAPYGSLKQ
jgi:RHS repeat-associated protein